MKFVSWNVNGLRACIQKGFLDYFNEIDADFFCLQETKLSEGQLQLSLPGYEQYWCYAEKKGYSGTAIFTKHTPLSVSYGIGVPELDTEGRVITLEYQEFYLVTCYTPNAQRGLARLDHRMAWDEAFRHYLQGLDEMKPVILCGDLNVAHKEIDLKNPSSNRGNAGFSDEERESFTKTLDMGFTDTFRHLYPDATGKYSWWSYMYHARENNAGWRIDYFLVSDRLQSSIERADIHSYVMGSDHCPVTLDLDTLVNGSIWSPSATGKAAVIEPDNKKKKVTKASAATAKALVTFGLLFALFLTVVIVFPLAFDHSLTPGDPPEDFSPFAVTNYYLPFYKGSSEGTGITIQSLGSEEKFYLDPAEYESSASMDNANTFLRVELTDEGLPYGQAGWTPVVEDQSPAVSFVQMAMFYDLACVKYYADPELTQFQGWLIWAESFGGKEFTLHFADGDGEYRHSENVSFTTYLSQEKADQLSTMELVRKVLEHEVIYDSLAGRLQNGLNPDFSACTQYPIYNELLTRTDAVGPLMYCDYGTDGWLNYELLSMPTFLNQMTPEEEADFWTRQFDNCPDELSLRYNGGFNSIPLQNYATEHLVYMLRDLDLYALTLCSSDHVRSLAYANFKEVYPLLTELETRVSAATAMMNASTYTLLEDGTVDTFCYVLHYLLNLDVYRNKMTPYEDAQYALCQYGYFLESTTLAIPELDAANMNTARLLFELEIYIGDLMNCKGNASRYHAYLYLIEYYPALEELMAREDLLDVLKPLSIFHQSDDPAYVMGSYNLYDHLIELRYYMDALLDTNMDDHE